MAQGTDISPLRAGHGHRDLRKLHFFDPDIKDLYRTRFPLHGFSLPCELVELLSIDLER